MVGAEPAQFGGLVPGDLAVRPGVLLDHLLLLQRLEAVHPDVHPDKQDPFASIRHADHRDQVAVVQRRATLALELNLIRLAPGYKAGNARGQRSPWPGSVVMADLPSSNRRYTVYRRHGVGIAALPDIYRRPPISGSAPAREAIGAVRQIAHV